MGSDDPAIFDTKLTDEYLKTAAAFGHDEHDVARLFMNGMCASLLDEQDKRAMVEAFESTFERKHGTCAADLAGFDICQ